MLDLRHATLLTMALIITLMASAPWVDAANPSQLQDAQLTRMLYIEPSYQIYIDDVTLTQPSNSYNITFLLPTPSVIFEAKAYDPQNQSLAITQIPQTTNGTYNGNLTLSVATSGFSAFRLVTIVQGMTYAIGNFSTLINFFPIVDEAADAATTIYLPLGSSLISYSLTSLSNSSQAGRSMIFGTRLLEPLNSTYGVVTFSGNFSTVAADSLLRTIRIFPTYIEFSETMTLVNAATTPLSTVILNTPSGGAGIAAWDTIGALQTSVSGSTVTVSLRNYVYHNEKVQFTLAYSLPTSVIQAEGGRSVLAGNVLPDFFNMPCSSANVTVIMPTWSSDPQIQGGQVIERYYGPVASVNFTGLTPYTNQAFRASYVPPSMTTPIVSAIAIAVLVIAILAAIVLKWRFFPSKQEDKPQVPTKGDAKQAAKGK